jgi:hypothetical protein
MKNVMTPYYSILDRDVPEIVAYSKSLAREGICADLKVYYRHEKIMVQSVACPEPGDLDGWKDSGVSIPCNVEYSRYYDFLAKNLTRVPLYA